MEAQVVVKNVNVNTVLDKLSKHQYSLIVPRNTIVLVVSPQNYKIFFYLSELKPKLAFLSIYMPSTSHMTTSV